jgi:hypothetical protein
MGISWSRDPQGFHQWNVEADVAGVSEVAAGCGGGLTAVLGDHMGLVLGDEVATTLGD